MKHINLNFKNQTELYTFGVYKMSATKLLCHKIKQNCNYAIEFAADIYASFLKEFVSSKNPFNDFYLIPVPGHFGFADHTRRLCYAISERTGIKVYDCILGKSRVSQYWSKKNQNRIILSEEMDMHIVKKNDFVGKPILIDVIADTGETLKACSDLFDDKVYAITLCISERMADDLKAAKAEGLC